MKMAISIFVLIMVFTMYKGWKLGGGTRQFTVIGTGLLSGLVQGSAGVGGPLAVSIALSRTGSLKTQRANVIGAVTALTFCAMLPMWYNDLFTIDIFAISCLIIPPYMFSTWLGARYFLGQGQKMYRSAALCILAIMGLLTLSIALFNHMELVRSYNI